MTSIVLIIPGEPVGKGRAKTRVATDRAGNLVRSKKTGCAVVTHYTPAKTRAYEDLVALVGTQAMVGRPPMQGGVAVTIDAVLPIPASWPKAKQQAARAGLLPATSRPDIDNIAKAVKDGLTGVAWKDDAQIVRSTLQKRYGSTPCVHVVITNIDTDIA